MVFPRSETDERQRPAATGSAQSPQPTLTAIEIEPGRHVVTTDASAVLLAGSVGSGLLVLVHDAVAGVAGVLHAVLPDSRLDTARSAAEPALFVDTGIRALLAELDAAGAVRERCRTHVVGAAEPRYVSATGPGLTVGRRNLEAITTALRMSALEITSNHTGSGEFQGARLEVGTGVVTLLKSRCREEVL